MNSSIKELCPLSEIRVVARGPAKDPSTWIYRGADPGGNNLFAVLFGPVPVQDIQPIVELSNMAFAHGFILFSEGRDTDDRKGVRDFINAAFKMGVANKGGLNLPFERILVSTDLPLYLPGKGRSVPVVNLYKNNKKTNENFLWQFYGDWSNENIRRTYEHAQAAFGIGRRIHPFFAPQIKDLIRRAFYRGEVVAAWQGTGISMELQTLLPL